MSERNVSRLRKQKRAKVADLLKALEAAEKAKRRAFVAEQRFFQAETKVSTLRQEIETIDRELFYAQDLTDSSRSAKWKCVRDAALERGCSREEARRAADNLCGAG